MTINLETLPEYLNQTKFVVLATVNDKQAPALRTLGSFAADGVTTYFSTAANTAKVKQIRANSQVSVIFQHEKQELKSFVNVTITGQANEVTVEIEREKAIKLLSNRNPRFRERAEKGEIGNNIFFRIDPQEVKVVDFSKGAGSQAIEVIAIAR